VQSSYNKKFIKAVKDRGIRRDRPEEDYGGR